MPWDLGAWNDVSIFFVTSYPLFTAEEAARVPGKLPGQLPSWQVSGDHAGHPHPPNPTQKL